MKISRRFCLVACAALLSTASLTASAQDDFPNKPIRVIVPFAAGGATDQVARVLADQLTKQMGVPVVVENRSGANGNIGAEYVASSPPDGYTILHNTSSIAFTAAFQQKVGYDLMTDLAPVSLLVNQPLIVVAGPSLAVDSLSELATWSKAHPDENINYASSGTGNISHLVMHVLMQSGGIPATNIPYKGGAPAFADVIGGRVGLLADPVNSALPFVKSKRVRAIATTGVSRSPLLPDVPTVGEGFMPGFEAGAWQGAMVPAKTPPAIVRRLHAEFVKAFQDPAVRDKFARDGADAVASTPEQYGAYLESEIDRWSKVVQSSGIKLE